METTFDIQAPHEEALALLRGKPIVTRQVFDGLLPELRARTFLVSGVEGANVVQRIQDSVSGIAAGMTWDEAKKQIVGELDPYLDDAAPARSELLLRTHGFQAFQAATWRTAQEDADTTHLQYLSMEDDHVRPTHEALNGIVLPKDDPFWQKHFPPWEWGCRCRTRTMNEDQVADEKKTDAEKNPEDKNVIEGPARTQLQNGTLIRDGRRYDVTAPADEPGKGSSAPFQWHPDNLRMPVEQLQARYDAPVWDEFEAWSKNQELENGNSVWDWLNERQRDFTAPATPPKKSANEETIAKLKNAKLTKAIQDAAESLPEDIAAIAARANYVSGTGRAHYSPAEHQIYLHKNPKNWSGRPSAFFHELGHHVHYETGIITATGVRPDFQAAIDKDYALWKKSAEEKLGAGWRERWDRRNPWGALNEAAKEIGLPAQYHQSMDMKQRASMVSDTVMGLSNGEYGTGHRYTYMQQNGAKEVFAHVFTALMTDDQAYMGLFKNVVELVRNEFSL